MNNKVKVLASLMLILGIVGCDKNNSTQVTGTTSNMSSTSVKSTTNKIMEKLALKSAPLKGYKSFEFGMSKEMLLKIPGCALTVQKSKEEQLVDALRGQPSIKPEITCTIDFMGSPTRLIPAFANNQLKSISIDLGLYEEDRYASLANELAKKYSVISTITEDQRTAFNSGAIPEVAMVYAEGQVALFIYNEKGMNFHDELGLTLDQSIQNATPTVTQKILLMYADLDQTKAMLEATAKGKTKSSDL